MVLLASWYESSYGSDASSDDSSGDDDDEGETSGNDADPPPAGGGSETGDLPGGGNVANFSCDKIGFVPAPSATTNYFDSVNSEDEAGSDQSQQQWNADNKLAQSQQKERDKAASDFLKQQGVSQKQQQDFEQNIERMQLEAQNNARKLEGKVQASHDKVRIANASAAVANRQAELNEELASKKLSSSQYLKELEISMNKAHQQRIDDLKKLNIQVSADEARLTITAKADHQKRVDDLAQQKEKDKASQANQDSYEDFLLKMRAQQMQFSSQNAAAAPPPVVRGKAQDLSNPKGLSSGVQVQDDGGADCTHVSGMSSRIYRLAPSPHVTARRTEVSTHPAHGSGQAQTALEVMRRRIRTYKDAVEYRATDETIPHEQRRMYRELFRVQLGILQEETIEAARKAEKASGQRNFDIALEAYQSCIRSIHSASGGAETADPRQQALPPSASELGRVSAEGSNGKEKLPKAREKSASASTLATDSTDAAYNAQAFCHMPCSRASECTMRQSFERLVKPIKECGNNHYPRSRLSGSTSGVSHDASIFGFQQMCAKKCNPDLNAKQLQPARRKGSSQLMVVRDGNACECPADMHFVDRTKCQSTDMPTDRANPACEPMYGGQNCEHVDTVFSSAERHPLLDKWGVEPTKVEDAKFVAICPAEHMYKDRTRCLRFSECLKEDSASGTGMLAFARHFTNRNDKRGTCSECVNDDGSDRPTNRRPSWINGQYVCSCPKAFNFKDAARCDGGGVSLAGAQADATAVAEQRFAPTAFTPAAPSTPIPGSSQPAAGDVSAKRTLMKTVSARVSAHSQATTHPAECLHGFTSLEGKPFCQVCADGFEPAEANNYTQIEKCVVIEARKNASSVVNQNRCGAPGTRAYDLQPGQAGCGENCNPDPSKDQACRDNKGSPDCCRADHTGDCSAVLLGKFRPCCKDPDKKMVVNAQGDKMCVCRNKDLMDQRNCTHTSPEDAVGYEPGYAVFQNNVLNKDFISSKWTDSAVFTAKGTPELKACGDQQEGCVWTDKDEALRVCSLWPDCMGVVEAEEGEIVYDHAVAVPSSADTTPPVAVPAPPPANTTPPAPASGKRTVLVLSAKVGRIVVTNNASGRSNKESPRTVCKIPVSARAAVFRPIRSLEVRHNDSKTLLDPASRLLPRGAAPDSLGHKVAENVATPAKNIYMKLCKTRGRDPKTQCKQCLAPYELDKASRQCVCPPTLDPLFCDPQKCRPNSGLDPGSRCTRCVNKNMKPNSQGICVCDTRNTRIDHIQCGGLDGTEAIKCAVGSGLHPPGCTECTKPTVRDHFVDMQSASRVPYCPKKDSLIRTIKCGSTNAACSSESACLSACTADPACQLVTYEEVGTQPATCTLFNSAPTKKCPSPPPSGQKAAMYMKQDVVAPVYDESTGRCVCPNASQSVDPSSGMCKCAELRYSPDTCASKSKGVVRYFSGEYTYDQARSACSRKGGGSRLAAIRHDADQELVEDLMKHLPANKRAFVGAMKRHIKGGSEQLQWTGASDYFYNVTAGTKKSGAYIGPVEEQKSGEAGLDTSQLRNGDCMVAYNKAGSVKWVTAPCSTKAGYLCELQPLPNCRNDTLDPEQDCKTCRNSFFSPDPNTMVCEVGDTLNPDWKADAKAPPLKKFANMVPSTLEYYTLRDNLKNSTLAPWQFGKLYVGADDTVNKCAEACMNFGKHGKKCQGFILGKSDEYDIKDDHTCLFITQKSGLGLDGGGATIAKKDKFRDTYLMQFCADSRKQFWTNGTTPCTQFEGTMLNDDGSCPENMNFADRFYCEPNSMCATTGTQSSLVDGDRGYCNRATCNAGVESSDPSTGKYCDVCAHKNTIGDITGDLSNGRCMQCDTNQVPMNPRDPKDCKCFIGFDNFDPHTNCKQCLQGFGGLDCNVTRQDCHNRGDPDALSMKTHVLCDCDKQAEDNKGSFTVKFSGDQCEKCADGWGPEPNMNSTYACSVRIGDTRCGPLGFPIGSKVDPRKPETVTCDCEQVNKSYALAANGGEAPGHWTGDVCDKCEETMDVPALSDWDEGSSVTVKTTAKKDKNGAWRGVLTVNGVDRNVTWPEKPTGKDASGKLVQVEHDRIELSGKQVFRNPTRTVKKFGGEHCNVDRTRCTNRGVPGPMGKYHVADDPECQCEGNFVTGPLTDGTMSRCKDAQCTPDYYGRLCNVPKHACGTIWETSFGADPNKADIATLDDPSCMCDTPELMTGMTYVQGSKNPFSKGKDSPCQCIDPLVLLSQRDSPLPKCVHKNEYCYNRGTYDTAAGKCACNKGYTGDRCDECDVGYANIQGSTLTDVTGKCDNVQEYCNYHANPARGKDGWDQTNSRCHCTAEYDNTQDGTCRAPACSEGHSPFSGRVPSKNEKGETIMLEADPTRCVNNREACGANHRPVGFAIQNNLCICRSDPKTGAFFVGNTRPYGDGKTVDPTPHDSYRPGQSDVCQFGPEYCNYPHGTPTLDGQCVCQETGTFASAGPQCQHTRSGTIIHATPVKGKDGDWTTPKAAIAGNANQGCFDRGRPIISGATKNADVFGVGLIWTKGDQANDGPKSLQGEVITFFGRDNFKWEVPVCDFIQLTGHDGSCPNVDTLQSAAKTNKFKDGDATTVESVLVPKGVGMRAYKSTGGHWDYNMCSKSDMTKKKWSKLGVDKGTLSDLKGASAFDAFVFDGYTCEVKDEKTKRFVTNKKLASALAKGKLTFTHAELDAFGIQKGELDVNSAVKSGNELFTPVAQGICACDMASANGAFCQYTMKKTCNGRGQPRLDGKCGKPMHEPKAGEFGNCTDDYSGLDCSIAPLGVPDCPNQDNCKPGCKASGVQYNCAPGDSGASDCCDKKKAKEKCCGGPGGGCGWFQHPVCAHDPNASHYPCICHVGKDDGSLGDQMVDSGKSIHQAFASGWRQSSEKRKKMTAADAAAAHQSDINALDANYLPSVDAKFGF